MNPKNGLEAASRELEHSRTGGKARLGGRTDGQKQGCGVPAELKEGYLKTLATTCLKWMLGRRTQGLLSRLFLR